MHLRIRDRSLSLLSSVSKDYSRDTFFRMAALHNKSCACSRKKPESMSSFMERFVGDAQAYMNLTIADYEPAENQKFSVHLLSNAHIPAHVFTDTMNNLL